MFFEIPTKQWSHQIPAVCKCVGSVHPTRQKTGKEFSDLPVSVRRTQIFQEQMGILFLQSFLRGILGKRVAFVLTIQIILISTFKSYHSPDFWKFPFPSLIFLSVLKILHKTTPRCFHNMSKIKSDLHIDSQFYHALAVWPWANC